MIKVLFVHGTGTREKRSKEIIAQTEKGLKKQGLKFEVVGCFWGDEVGASLNFNGLASLPSDNNTRSIGGGEGTDFDILLWEHLYLDPLYELKIIARTQPVASSGVSKDLEPYEVVEERIKSQPLTPAVLALLSENELEEIFEEVRRKVTNSTEYKKAIKTIKDEAAAEEYYPVIARSIVAELIQIQSERAADTLLIYDATLRDELVKELENQFNEDTYSRGIGKLAKDIAGWVTLGVPTMALENGRENFMMKLYPFIGDILVYQGYGEKIREVIRKNILECGDEVIVLAHSLGGIACVDLLIKEKLPQVKLLVTVGSQAPFFYEIGALQNLSKAGELSYKLDKLPKWLNIYDKYDFLSFVGEGIFGEKVLDERVNNRQPFPLSHGAYFSNKETWQKFKKGMEWANL